MRQLLFACAQIDALEPRRLLASVGIQSGVLTVNADSTNDVITINPASGGQVTVSLNGGTSSFSAAAFSSILVNGNAGNDGVTINNTITKPATVRGGAGNDSLVGGGGSDVLDGGAGADTLKGGGGNDTADYSSRTANLNIGLGTLSDDGAAGEKDNVWYDIETVLGGSGDDLIKGHANNNLLVGNGGNDTLKGNYGNDTLEGGPGADLLNGEAGNDTGVNVAGDKLISIENTTGSGGQGTVTVTPDRTLVVTGTSGHDVMSVNVDSTDGGDTFEYRVRINGVLTGVPVSAFDRAVYNLLGGNDTLELEASFMAGEPFIPETVNAGDGNDVIRFEAGAGAFVSGGAGDDTLEVDDNGGVQIFDGGPGVDSFLLRNLDATFLDMAVSMPTVENAQIYWGTLLGNALNNELRNVGGGTMNGRGGNDTLIAGGGDASILLGGDGNDLLLGNDYGDTLDGGAGADTLKGGAGNDTADYSNRTANLTIGLGTLADDGEAGEKDNVWFDIETVLGGSGDDHIKGHANNNRLVGNGGSDTVMGNYGDDTLVGGPGSDTLNGEAGNDTATDSAGDLLISIENVA